VNWPGDWPTVRTHIHPDGTVVASVTLDDGRVLRVVGEAPRPRPWDKNFLGSMYEESQDLIKGPCKELWNTLFLMLLEARRV
jgi:hypothetical protein